MISFRKISFFERIYRMINPVYARRKDEKTKDAIRYLVENPDKPCVIGGTYIPHGRGIDLL